MRKDFTEAEVYLLGDEQRQQVIADTSGEIDDETHASHAGRLLTGWFIIGTTRQEVKTGDRCRLVFYSGRSPRQYDVTIGECGENYAEFIGDRVLDLKSTHT